MNPEIMHLLEPITPEEQEILAGSKQIQKEIYTTSKEFTVDSAKMLAKGRLIDIRTHTRFVSFPSHRHNYIEIMYMCSGSTTHVINGTTTLTLERGDLLFFNQYSSHEIYPAGQKDIGINFIVLPEFFDAIIPMLGRENALSNFLVSTLCQKENYASFLHFKVADILPIQNLVENLVWTVLNQPLNHRQLNQTTMGLLFMQLVNYADRIDQDASSVSDSAIAIQTLKYIEEEYRTANLTEFASKNMQSLSGMSKQIKTSTGKTFKELLQEKRLQQAAHFLSSTALPVTDIIYRTGYNNTSYFHRIFKEKYGVSPKNFRDAMTKSGQ